MDIFKGISGAAGIAGGKIVYFEKPNENAKSSKKAVISIDEAVKRSLDTVNALYSKAKSELGDEHAKIFSAYKMLLEDDMLIGPMKQLVQRGTSDVDAVESVTSQMSAMLAKKNNEYMRQRADDIKYIGQIIVSELLGGAKTLDTNYFTEKVIIAAYELTPVDTMQFNTEMLAGLVTEAGGATSHTVILAKSLGIPAVVGVQGLNKCRTASFGYINGYSGEFAVDVDTVTKAKYDKLVEGEKEFKKTLSRLNEADAVTADGKRIQLCVNIGKPSDLKNPENTKFDGVGLFRSEFLYSSSSQKPNVNEQRNAYTDAILKVYPNTVTIRTLDVGGDKQLEYLNMKKEENPFLGNRGIRLCLQNEEIFSEQIEAILTACADKEVKIMLPLVTSVNEISKTRKIIDDIKQRLNDNGTAYSKNIMLGIMIETPASAIMADVFAKHCDFFSIGTNDLVQYIMAADRGNSDVEQVYNPYHPSVLRMISRVINEGKKAGIEVSVCGDLAANTEFTEILIGMGLTKLSVPLPMVNRLKYKLSLVNTNEAKKKADAVLNASNEDEIKNILKVR